MVGCGARCAAPLSGQLWVCFWVSLVLTPKVIRGFTFGINVNLVDVVKQHQNSSQTSVGGNMSKLRNVIVAIVSIAAL